MECDKGSDDDPGLDMEMEEWTIQEGASESLKCLCRWSVGRGRLESRFYRVMDGMGKPIGVLLASMVNTNEWREAVAIHHAMANEMLQSSIVVLNWTRG